MALRLRSAPIWQEPKGFATLAYSRAHLSESGNAAGIATNKTTAKAIGIAMRLCICVYSNDFQVA